MKNRSFALALITATLLFSSAAHADNDFHPSRARLIMHGGGDITERTRFELRFVPAGNLLGKLAPLLYVGFKFKLNDWMGIETYTGWTYGKDEPLLSLSFNFRYGAFWAFTEDDLQLPSGLGYWFVQFERNLTKRWIIGIEGEGWGDYKNIASWSHGFGPNVLYRAGLSGVDLALHLRELNGEIKPELFIRFHVFL